MGKTLEKLQEGLLAKRGNAIQYLRIASVARVYDQVWNCRDQRNVLSAAAYSRAGDVQNDGRIIWRQTAASLS